MRSRDACWRRQRNSYSVSENAVLRPSRTITVFDNKPGLMDTGFAEFSKIRICSCKRPAISEIGHSGGYASANRKEHRVARRLLSIVVENWVLSSLRLLEGLACSHRLWGLPSSSGSPSLLHLRALAPQKHVASSWQGTVEPQPPPHARSVVAWPVARQGFYGGQPTSYPGSDLSHGRSHSPHPNVTGSYDERLTCNVSFSNMTVRDDRSYHQTSNRRVYSAENSKAKAVFPFYANFRVFCRTITQLVLAYAEGPGS